MRAGGLSFFGAVLTVVMLVLALWIIQEAGAFARTWGNPQLAVWAFRTGAVAVFAAAQVVGLTLVISTLWKPTPAVEWLGRGATLVFTLALVTAITFGLIGR